MLNKWWYTLEHMLEDYSGRKTRQKSAPSGVETAPKWPIYDQKCLVWPLEAQKSVFCYWTPDFVNGPFVALGDSFDLAPADPFLNFSFPSYGRFREGDPPTQQKVLAHLTVGALSDSNSPSARSALALRARALRARAG